MNRYALGLSALFVLVFVGLAIWSSRPAQVKDVEVYNLHETPEFINCTVDYTQDYQIILVSQDVAKCGDSVSLHVDGGNVISGVVDGIIDPAPYGMVQVSFIRDGKFVTALSQNQIGSIIVY